MMDDLNASGGGYLEELYQLWLKNPEQVPLEWHGYFENLTRTSETGTEMSSYAPLADPQH